MTVKEMGDLLGLKKTERYWLVHKHYFKTEVIAGRMMVDDPSFEKWYANQVKYRKITGEEPGHELKEWSYSVREVAELLDVDDAVIYEIIRKEQMETVIVDFVKRVPKDAFEKWYEKQKLLGKKPYRTYEDRQKDADTESRTLSVEQIASLLGIRRKEADDILHGGRWEGLFDFVTVAGKERITKRSFERWYARQDQYHYVPKGQSGQAMEGGFSRVALHRKNREAIHNKRGGDGNHAWLTREEAALLGKVSASTVTFWYNCGFFPVKKFGTLIRIPRMEYEQFLQERMKEKEPV